jgi:cell division protein FtsN
MTDNDRRGAYTPPNDEPLHFDARRPRSGGGTPPTTLLVSAVVLLVLIGGAFAYYRSGIRHEGQPPAVVGTPVGQMKTEAPPSAQPSDPAAGLQVYNSETPQATTPAPTLAPAPEEPLPRISGPAPSTRVAEATLPAAPPARSEETAPAKAAPVRHAATPAAKTTAPADEEIAANTPAKTTVKTAPVKTAIGAAAVQIGAFSSSAQADKGWNDAARAAPGKMVGKGKKVETVAKGGSTLYRTFVTGFASRDDASAFCDELKAAGKVCLVK